MCGGGAQPHPCFPAFVPVPLPGGRSAVAAVGAGPGLAFASSGNMRRAVPGISDDKRVVDLRDLAACVAHTPLSQRVGDDWEEGVAARLESAAVLLPRT